MNTKYKLNMKGWFKDSWRHMLAARGIKTKYDKANSRHYLTTKIHEAPMLTLYHGTQKERVPSVLKKGLSKPVFLTGSKSAAIMHAEHGSESEHGWVVDPAFGGKSRYEKGLANPAILQVKIPAEWVEDKPLQEGYVRRYQRHAHDIYPGRYEYRLTEHDISPKQIKEIDFKKFKGKAYRQNPQQTREVGKYYELDDKIDQEDWTKEERKEAAMKRMFAKKPTTWSEPNAGIQLVGRHKKREPLQTVTPELLEGVSWLKNKGAKYEDVKAVYPKNRAVRDAWLKLEGVEDK